MRAPALALAALAAAGLACQSDPPYASCPGERIATFAFEGGGDLPAPALLPGEEALPTCPGAPTALSFTAAIAFDPDDAGAAALCTDRRLAVAARGTRTGDAIDVSTTTGGAVLAACSSKCLVEVTERVAGTLLPDATAPERFEGALVDTVRAAAGAVCEGDGCTLPCAARYAIESVP